MSVFSMTDKRPKCCYCGEPDIHADFTCPRIKSVTLYPDGTTEVTLWEPEWEIIIEADDQANA